MRKKYYVDVIRVIVTRYETEIEDDGTLASYQSLWELDPNETKKWGKKPKKIRDEVQVEPRWAVKK